ncbi:hypothetical protein F8M41_014591 [Gigaspora margarita]|uniref:Uncharacterized protein n=1 Tax=Gigaspora margarita TaxID=4874 RepID=A0A8H4B5L8_GIGMA|nr:hypothetical protein F8M41_014591 [Gigaspora margarita]
MPGKVFKIAVEIDSIYGAQHGKYVSEIQLAISAIKYSIFPNAKDIDEELYTYLAKILTLLSGEKSSTNTIDFLLASIPADITKMKFCSNFLLHIETISGIKNKVHKWIVVTCDGVPYRLATKLKKKFPWLVLVPGQIHKEINMLHTYVELNCKIDLKCFAISQGYKLKISLPILKNVLITIRHGILFTFFYLQAIINYQKAIRTNNPFLKRATKRTFSPIWSGRHHPIYHLIEVANEVQLMQLYPEVHNIVENNSVISRSGICNQHQELDAIIEEINKNLKVLIPSVPQYHYWKIAARNCKKFVKLRNNLFKIIGYNNQSSEPRTRPEATIECQRL